MLTSNSKDLNRIAARKEAILLDYSMPYEKLFRLYSNTMVFDSGVTKNSEYLADFCGMRNYILPCFGSGPEGNGSCL
jgi:hypothetical protein